MKILFTMKSYEITYKREVIRLVSLILIFLSLVFVGILWKSMPKIVNDFVFCILIYLPFMLGWSVLRLSQISDNKGNSIKMKKDDFYEIVQTYPASKFLILNDEKYVIYNPSIELQDEIILLRKDNKYLKKEDINNLLSEREDV